MWRSATRNAAVSLLLGMVLSVPAWADDEPAAPTQTAASTASAPTQEQEQADWDKVMELGKIEVHASPEEQSKQIIAGLKVIKRALRANLSNDPADARQVVCRMNYDTGSHLNAHLMCATNRSMMIYRDQLHAAVLAATYGQPDGSITQQLEQMKGHVDPARYFSTHISAAELQKLLLVVQCDGCSNSGLVVGNN